MVLPGSLQALREVRVTVPQPGHRRGHADDAGTGGHWGFGPRSCEQDLAPIEHDAAIIDGLSFAWDQNRRLDALHRCQVRAERGGRLRARPVSCACRDRGW